MVPVFSDPDRDFENEHVAYGAVDESEVLDQPIQCSHVACGWIAKLNVNTVTHMRNALFTGIPSTQICMNCHGLSPNGQLKVDPTGRPELYKLLSYNYGADEARLLLVRRKGRI